MFFPIPSSMYSDSVFMCVWIVYTIILWMNILFIKKRWPADPRYDCIILCTPTPLQSLIHGAKPRSLTHPWSIHKISKNTNHHFSCTLYEGLETKNLKWIKITLLTWKTSPPTFTSVVSFMVVLVVSIYFLGLPTWLVGQFGIPKNSDCLLRVLQDVSIQVQNIPLVSKPKLTIKHWVPSLKLTASLPLKMDGWKMILSFRGV